MSSTCQNKNAFMNEELHHSSHIKADRMSQPFNCIPGRATVAVLTCFISVSMYTSTDLASDQTPLHDDPTHTDSSA